MLVRPVPEQALMHAHHAKTDTSLLEQMFAQNVIVTVRHVLHQVLMLANLVIAQEF